jgi:hypothetical protein
MREGFVLYAYNLAGEFSVPIARVIMLSGDYRFFEKNGAWGFVIIVCP